MILKQTKKVPIPHEDGQWVEVLAKIPPVFLQEAAEETAFHIQRIRLRLIGDVPSARDVLQKAMASGFVPDGKAGYDWEQLLSKVIINWSYDETPTPDIMRYLDSETRDFLINHVWEQIEPEDQGKE